MTRTIHYDSNPGTLSVMALNQRLSFALESNFSTFMESISFLGLWLPTNVAVDD
jgi:hypothetical protein